MSFNIFKKLLFKHFVFKYSKILAKVNLKPTEFVLKENDKCLCLVPHADDEAIGMGGVLSKYPKNFDMILLTDGRKGIKNLASEDVIKTRELEFSNSMAVPGIENFRFLKTVDKHLIDNIDIFRTIDFENYDYIFVPNLVDQHPDHKAVAILLKELIQNGVRLKQEVKICFYEVWAPLALVNAYCDISNFIELKKKMIKCYPSQTKTKDYEYYSLGLNMYRGMLKDIKFAEAFCVVSLEDFSKIVNLYG